MLGHGQPQHTGFGGVAAHRDQAGGRGVFEGRVSTTSISPRAASSLSLAATAVLPLVP